jgi:MFS family permease
MQVIHKNRLSVALMFFINGFLFATWASRIPVIQESLVLSHGMLGTVLLGLPLGSLCSLPVAGWLTTRYGSRIVVIYSVVIYAFTLPLLAMAESPMVLALMLFLFGAGGDCLNISMNTQAVAIENEYPKPIMSSFHALYSLGGMFGAALGGLVGQWSWTPLFHFTLFALMAAALALVFVGMLKKNDLASGTKQPLLARPDATLIGMGIIAFCCMMGEGAMADWSSVYLAAMPGSLQEFSTAGFTAFSLAMAAGRFSGDRLTAKLGVERMLKGSGIIAAMGLLLALSVQNPVVVVLGFTLVGAGLSTVVPLAYSAAGRSTSMPSGVALAAVSTVGYTGFLIGPPLIGWIADLSSLRLALMLIVLLALCISMLAPRVQ